MNETFLNVKCAVHCILIYQIEPFLTYFLMNTIFLNSTLFDIDLSFLCLILASYRNIFVVFFGEFTIVALKFFVFD